MSGKLKESGLKISGVLLVGLIGLHLLAAVQAQAADAARVAGDLRITGAGSRLVFPDGTVQHSAAAPSLNVTVVKQDFTIKADSPAQKLVIPCPEGMIAIHGGISAGYYTESIICDPAETVGAWCVSMGASSYKEVSATAYAICVPGAISSMLINGQKVGF